MRGLIINKFFFPFSSQKWETLIAAALVVAQKGNPSTVTLRALGECVRRSLLPEERTAEGCSGVAEVAAVAVEEAGKTPAFMFLVLNFRGLCYLSITMMKYTQKST